MRGVTPHVDLWLFSQTLSSPMAARDMSSNICLNAEQQEIVNSVLAGHNVIICGQAGVGKTRVINVMYKTIKQKKQRLI